VFSGKDFDKVSQHFLLWEFFKMTWKRPVVRKGTIWCLFVDLVHNLYYLLQLFMSLYLFDNLLHKDENLFFIQDRKKSLMIWAGITLVATAITHVLDYSKLDSKVGSTAKAFMMNAIIRQYLNYSSYTRQSVEDGEVVMAVQRDVDLLVKDGYMGMLMLIRMIVKVFFMVLFKFLSPVIFEEEHDMVAIVPMLLFPVTLCLFLPIRAKTTLSVISDQNEKEVAVTDQIDMTTDNYGIILDYERRSVAAELFDKCVQAHNRASKAASQVMLNTEYFLKWVTALIVGGYTYYGGVLIIDGYLSIGLFITNVGIFGACGMCFAEIYQILVTFDKIQPSMANITKLLNLPTDDPERMKLSYMHQRRSAELRAELKKSEVASDLLL
jgi:ABC-type bacteriocin/lantibiotic exporter with double-glycine peptidase domain